MYGGSQSLLISTSIGFIGNLTSSELHNREECVRAQNKFATLCGTNARFKTWHNNGSNGRSRLTKV